MKENVFNRFSKVFCKADRQKTNDVREVKEALELKLMQTSKSANVEIHRLVSCELWLISFMGYSKKEMSSGYAYLLRQSLASAGNELSFINLH